MQPKLGWTPDGFLGGYLYGDQERDYKNTLGLSQLSSALGVQDQQNKLHEYGLNDVVRNAERAANVAKADTTTQTILPQTLANIAQVKAQTRATDANADTSNINNITLQRRNLAELSKTEMETRIRQMDELEKLAQQAAFMGPAAQAYVQQEAKRLGIPEQYHQALFQNPDKVLGHIARTRPQYIQAMDVQERENQGRISAANARPKPDENIRTTMWNSIVDDLRRQYPNKDPRELKAMATERFNAQTAGAGKPFTPGEQAAQNQAALDLARYERELNRAILSKDTKAIAAAQEKVRKAIAGLTAGGNVTRAAGGEEIIDLTPRGNK
jgi:hypothetical protein